MKQIHISMFHWEPSILRVRQLRFFRGLSLFLTSHEKIFVNKIYGRWTGCPSCRVTLSFFSSSSSPPPLPVHQRTRQKLEFSRLFSFKIRLKSIVSINSFYFSINSFYLLLDLECDLTCLFFSLIIINRINHNVTS